MLLALLVSLAASGFPQTLDFKNFTSREGLISDEVYTLYQDKQGYLWIFSPYGTLKYNGSEFVTVFKNLPAKESFMYSICESKSGRKWVANSNAKIFEVRNDSAILLNGLEKISASLKASVGEIGKLAVDDSLNLFAITKWRSYKIIKKQGACFAVTLTRATGGRREMRLYRLGHDLIWVFDHAKSSEFVLHYADSAFLQFENRKYVMPFPYFSYHPRGFIDYNGTVCFLHQNYLCKLEPGKSISAIQVRSSHLMTFVKDKRGHTWIGALNDGLYELNENDSVIGHYLENTTVNCVLIDHQSGLWLSTPGLGLFRCAGLNSRMFKATEPLGAPISFIKELDDRCFVATVKGDVFVKEKDKWLRLREADNKTPVALIRYKTAYLLLFNHHTEY